MAIVDIRGTNGSGKSWVVHELLRRHPASDILEDGKAIGHHLAGLDVAVVGRYDRVCGGCDGIGTADEVCRRVRLFATRYRHVLLEGILVAHTHARYAALAEELGDYHFLFLNTPLRTCAGRVRARRWASGNQRPFNPANLIKDWHGINERVLPRLRAGGHNVVVVDYKDPVPYLYRVLGVNDAD